MRLVGMRPEENTESTKEKGIRIGRLALRAFGVVADKERILRWTIESNRFAVQTVLKPFTEISPETMSGVVDAIQPILHTPVSAKVIDDHDDYRLVSSWHLAAFLDEPAMSQQRPNLGNPA